jgi:hypothetical protein
MCDPICVLGSRHGLFLDPVNRQVRLLRFNMSHSDQVLQIRAGAVINGVEHVLPLCHDGQPFRFFDQRLSPCTVAIMGIDPETAIKVKLTFVTPFRPRDAAFSTIPVLGLRLEAELLAGHFRWTGTKDRPAAVELFLELAGEGIQVEPASNGSLALRFTSMANTVENKQTHTPAAVIPFPQEDRLVPLSGRLQGTRFTQTVSLDTKAEHTPLTLAWCTHSEPVLEVMGRRHPFRYTRQFKNLGAVCDWAAVHGAELFENAARVDGIVGNNNLSKSTNDLLAQTLHSFLANSWWVDREDKEWFSVWEGNCFFHSTVDVEYTQAPFYLAVWPELLGLELDQWTAYSKDGSLTVGERGKGTLFLSHDCGQHTVANAQVYPHEMEVEETTNYLILLYAHWRRTGDDRLVREKVEFVEKYLAFLQAADTTGNHIPDKGVANTVDDASPAIQFGREQVYLAVKTMAAFACGSHLLRAAGRVRAADALEPIVTAIRARMETDGWQDDHYVTLLDKSGKGIINPWTHEAMTLETVPGWDSAHIYTENGLALLDMVGLDLGLSPERLQTDLRVATTQCLREYGCVHSAYSSTIMVTGPGAEGLAGAALSPGWISMNMLRDIAAFYRGVDLRALVDRYWQWQVTVNTQEPKGFFETFNGNNLHIYPRGVAIWGYFDALAGLVIDKAAGVDLESRPFTQIRVPRLLDADWAAGTCPVIET